MSGSPIGLPVSVSPQPRRVVPRRGAQALGKGHTLRVIDPLGEQLLELIDQHHKYGLWCLIRTTLPLGVFEGLLGGSASDKGKHPSNYRDRPAEVAASDGGERSARAAIEARLVLYGLAQVVLGAGYARFYVPARKGETEVGLGENKVPGLGVAPADRASGGGFLLEREEGFLGKTIYLAPHRFPP
jgi:hypothetical protein